MNLYLKHNFNINKKQKRYISFNIQDYELTCKIYF
jgi:hypothetical protein